MKDQKKGFTLVEIMIVVAVIGLLSVIAVPNFQQARATTQQNACLNNIKKIDIAKDQYALDNNINVGTTPDDSTLEPYIRGGIQIAKACPSRGAISVNAIGSDPTCTIHSSSSSGNYAVTSSSGGSAVLGFSSAEGE